MESVGLLITLVFLKQHLGDSSVTSYFSSVCELSAVKMEISIAIKTTIPANKSICDGNTEMVVLRSHRAAEGGRCSFFAVKITVVFAAASFQLEFGLWFAAVRSGSSGGGCRAAPAQGYTGGTSRRNVSGCQKPRKC